MDRAPHSHLSTGLIALQLAQAPLVTLDARLARAQGPTCEIRVFSAAE